MLPYLIWEKQHYSGIVHLKTEFHINSADNLYLHMAEGLKDLALTDIKR